jgi:hypothetical protein
MGTNLCEPAAQALDAAGYYAAARQMRTWQPVALNVRAARRRALDGWLSWIEGATDVAEKHAADEVASLNAAYDAVEAELDRVEQEEARARHSDLLRSLLAGEISEASR